MVASMSRRDLDLSSCSTALDGAAHELASGEVLGTVRLSMPVADLMALEYGRGCGSLHQ